MESQAVRRRINTITAHFLPSSDELSATQVLPMNCSSTLNSVILRRHDNRLYFARQGGSFQPSFMRQGSIEDVVDTENQSQNSTTIASPNESTRRFDNKLFFARQGSAHQAIFMRQGCNVEETVPTESDTPLKSSSPVTEYSYYVSQERPLFSRPSTEPRFTTTRLIPKLATATSVVCQQNEPCLNKDTYSSPSSVVEWSPRMDVSESGRSYIITIEIPGVNVKDIWVEVNDKRLTVTGSRSTQYMKVAECSNDPVSAYLRREIVQGPYSVIWPLPANVNKDCVSAELLDGFLRVVIPKL